MFDIDLVVTGLVGIKQSKLNEIHKASWRALGQHWRKKYLRGHFTHAGARKYGYTLRKGEVRPGGTPIPGSYTWTKLKRQSHTRPLEFYGHAKAKALGEEKISPTRFSVKVLLPQGFNRRHPRSAVRMNDEIRAVTPAELAELQRFWAADLTKRIDRVAGGQTYRIRAWH